MNTANKTKIIPESYNNKSKRIKIPNTNSKGEYVP